MDSPRRVTALAGGAVAALALAAAAALALAAAAAPAMASAGSKAGSAASASSGWKVVYKHHFGAPASQNAFLTLVAPSQHQAWALGGSDNYSGHPIAARWTGGKWRYAPLPAGLHGDLVAASASSTGNVWAVSQLGQVVLHWNGHRWLVAKSWHISSEVQLTGVIALSPTNVWVFGSGGFTGGLGTWHYSGHSWKHLTSGAANGITKASAVSGSNIWAIGSRNAPQDSIVHYSHGRWQFQTAAALANHQFNGILSISASSVWAYTGPAAGQPSGILLHYNGTRWSRVRIPGKASKYGQLLGISADGHGGFWLESQHSILHRTAAGRWASPRANPEHVFTLSLIPGTSTVLAPGAVAEAGVSTGSDAAVYQNLGLG